jgi:hypothetical protein
MAISNDIHKLIYEIADISSAISDAITPSGLGKAASVTKKVVNAAQDSDTAKNTKSILDKMDAARNAAGPKTPGNMSPDEFKNAINKNPTGAARAVHKAAANINNTGNAPAAHKVLPSKWATDEKGLVKGTKLTPEQYSAYRVKHGGVAATHTPVAKPHITAKVSAAPAPVPAAAPAAAKIPTPAEVVNNYRHSVEPSGSNTQDLKQMLAKRAENAIRASRTTPGRSL